MQTAAGIPSRATYEAVDDTAVPIRLKAPFYRVALADSQYRRDPAVVFSDISHGPVSVTQTYSFFDEKKADWVQPVTLTAIASVPQPVPVWPGGRPEVGLIEPSKVDYLPTPGLDVSAGSFWALRWIENGILYALDIRVQYATSGVQAYASSLQSL